MNDGADDGAGIVRSSENEPWTVTLLDDSPRRFGSFLIVAQGTGR
jgi:hypothetical protein